jgi:uncharacterized membrane protein (DUF485 family)
VEVLQIIFLSFDLFIIIPMKIQETEEFRKFVSKKWAVSLSLAFVMLVAYFGFILTVAFYKEVLATKISEGLTLGLPVGLGIIILAWVLTGIYVGWANKQYDSKVEELKKKLK